MTEPGQLLNWPRTWIVTYYSYRWWFISFNLLLLVSLWWMHIRYRFLRSIWMYLASIGVILCIIVANFLLPAFFPSYQKNATYVSVSTANKLLKNDSIIYAVEINGDTVGFPKKHLEIPHVVGATVGGKEIVMTFCALSNLPVVYKQDIGYGESDLRILIQTHNNLLMVDKKSGELVQQINGKLEYSGKRLPAIPNDMMKWSTFKKRYPNARVFLYPFVRPLDNLLLALFEGGMEQQFSHEHGPMFPTLSLKDKRLPNKEQVWGLTVGKESAAFSRAFLAKHPRYTFSLGDKKLVVTYEKSTDIAKAFTLNDQGKLKALPLYNGVFWMVWAHWFPETKVFKANK